MLFIYNCCMTNIYLTGKDGHAQFSPASSELYVFLAGETSDDAFTYFCFRKSTTHLSTMLLEMETDDAAERPCT